MIDPEADMLKKTQIVTRMLGLVLFAPVMAFADPALDDQLHRAVLSLDAPAVKTAVAKGANANALFNGRSLLGWAAQGGDVGVVRALLAAGASPDHVDGVGHTPLMRAIDMQNLEIVRTLLQARPDLGIRDQRGQTVTMLAVASGRKDILEAVLAAGADPSAADPEGNSPALVALMFAPGDNEAAGLIALLGRHGAEMNHANAAYSPLIYAIDQDKPALVAAVLAAGADPGQVVAERVPLAVALGNTEIMGMLLKAGARPDVKLGNGDPILFRAMSDNNMAAVETLLAAGADPNAPDSAGRTPLAMAEFDEAMTALLKKHGATAPAAATATEPETTPATAAAPSAAVGGVPALPRYRGSTALFEQDAIAIYLTADPMPKVAAETRSLIERAGWKGRQVAQTDTMRHLEFERNGTVLTVQVSIAPAQGNKTTIQYSMRSQ